jgi:hypothetical protein
LQFAPGTSSVVLMSKLLRFALLLLAACDAGAPPDPSSVEGLNLSHSDQTRIAGRYLRDGVQLDFDAQYADSTRRSLLLSARGQEELLRVDHEGDRFTTSAFGGRAKVIVDLSVLRESARLDQLPPEERPAAFSTVGGVRLEGDQTAFDELERRPEYAALPWLSRTLGTSGFDGQSHPVALILHHAAMQAAAQLDVQLPPTNPPSSVPGTNAAALESCVDLQNDPYNNDSLGMCGPGSSCWQWVCGDCCCHAGCKSHDNTCRKCTWYRPWNCTLCATFASFMNGQCNACGGDSFVDPPCAEIGYECGAAQCCETYDGSTEAAAAPQNVVCGSPGGIDYPDVPPVCYYQ